MMKGQLSLAQDVSTTVTPLHEGTPSVKKHKRFYLLLRQTGANINHCNMQMWQTPRRSSCPSQFSIVWNKTLPEPPRCLRKCSALVDDYYEYSSSNRAVHVQNISL